MALPSSGPISLGQVNIELKKTATSIISLNDSNVRKLAGKPSGIISMEDLRGKKASEYVENYQIFSGSYRSEQNGWKGYNITVNIPKNIIKGKFIINYRKSGDGYEGGISSKINVNNLFSDNNVRHNKTIEVNKENFINQNLSDRIEAGYGQSKSGSGYYNYINTTHLNIKFTGEWEA